VGAKLSQPADPRSTRRSTRGLISGLLVVSVLAAAGPALAHPLGAPASPSTLSPIAAPATAKLELRGCWMTVMFVPRPQEVLERALPSRVDLSARFYGRPDPLLTTWTLRCKQARTARKRIRKPILSLVAAATGLTDPAAVPLANNFAHALVAVDTNRRELARRLRRGGLPARWSRLRYVHSRAGAVPFRARFAAPGSYRLDVAASTLDVVHDHDNTFEYRPARGRPGLMRLLIEDAVDRFCFVSADGGCEARLATPERSGLGRTFGGPSAPVFLGLDHARIPRVEIGLGRG
jgi:hypothetical protein